MLRLYHRPTTKMNWVDGRKFCSDQNKGLVVWDTADIYEDVKFIAYHAGEDLYTALYNIDKKQCGDKNACSDKLVGQLTV